MIHIYKIGVKVARPWVDPRGGQTLPSPLPICIDLVLSSITYLEEEVQSSRSACVGVHDVAEVAAEHQVAGHDQTLDWILYVMFAIEFV